MTAQSMAAPPADDQDSYAGRIQRLRRQMQDADITAVALTSPENVYYLTGLDHLGYFAFTLLVVPVRGVPALITRAMERATVRAQVPWCRHLTFDEDEPAATAAAAVLAESARGGVLAWDEESMFFPPSVADGIRRLLPEARWRNGSTLLAGQRTVKSDREVALVRNAARVSDLAMQRGVEVLRPGVTEREVAGEIYRTLVTAGSQPPGFAPLIRPTTILDQEHTTWSDGTVLAGQAWFLELSASVRRYHAPLSRTVYVGYAPAAAREAADAALAGLTAARHALRPGARTGDVYAAWERAVAGHPARVWPPRHHCGYLVGIGFPPSWVGGGQVAGIRSGGTVEIVPGMTFHLMSWVNQPVGHVVSDTALVTPTGAELLTTTPRELTVVAPEGT